jgi:hypothetical protein
MMMIAIIALGAGVLGLLLGLAAWALADSAAGHTFRCAGDFDDSETAATLFWWGMSSAGLRQPAT